jgi:hypothetical protein
MWLVIVTIIVFVTTIIIMPKRLTWLEIYTTGWFALTLQLFTDIILDLKYDLYGYFINGVDLKGLIPILGLYPTYNTIFLNLFPKSNRWKQMLYIIGNVVFLTCYEYAILQTEVFYYNGWKLWYSVLCYPVILLILYWNLMITRLLLVKARR